VATLPAATVAAVWDTELTNLKNAFTAATPANFVGYTAGFAGKKIGLTAFLHFVRHENPGMTPAQDLELTQAAYAAFVKADADEDLHLSPDEWNTLMANMRPNHDTRFNTWIGTAQFPNNFDVTWNAGGKLTQQAFSNEVDLKATTGLKAVAQARSATAFAKADADGDKKLTHEEFKALVADNNMGAGKDAFNNWVLKLAGEADPLRSVVHAAKLAQHGLGAALAVDANDEITEDAWITWVAPKAGGPPPTWDVEKVVKAKNLFDSWDADNSGALSKTEIANANSRNRRAAAAVAARAVTPGTERDWAKRGHGILPPVLGGALDGNSDSKVTVAEMLDWAKTKDTTEAIVPQILKAFNAADKNGDAALDRDELKDMLRRIASVAADNTPIVADTSKDPSKSLCFTNDVDYYGHDVHTFIGKGSAAACQRSCGTVNGANYFQFEPSRNSKPSVCWCKSSRAGERPHTHRTVGPLFCPGGGPGPELGSGGPDKFVGAWESRTVDKPTNGVAIVGAVMGSGALAMALVMWLAGKRYSGRPQQMEAVPLQVQE